VESSHASHVLAALEYILSGIIVAGYLNGLGRQQRHEPRGLPLAGRNKVELTREAPS
jgi:hypothetical protein